MLLVKEFLSANQASPKKVVASDKNHRPCLPLKPQEKSLLDILTKNILCK
jgi:hypothetical protein